VDGCQYRLDRRDQIVQVDDGWARFAREAGAGELLSPGVLRRPIWQFVSDARTRLLQSLLLRRVRTTRIPIVLPFRCDSPGVKRWMEMELRATGDGGVTVSTRLLRQESRPPVHLLEPGDARSGGEVLKVCGWCNTVQLGEGPWQEVEDLLAENPHWVRDGETPEITHRLCSDCDTRLVEASG
jgi:hypothetical protein